MGETNQQALEAVIEQLRLSEARYRSIFETAASMITSVDEQGTIVDCNPRSADVLGYRPEELVGCSMGKIIHPEDMHQAQASLEEILDCGYSWNKNYRMVRKDGELRHVRINSSGLKGADGGYERTICVIEDVTEARQLDEERRRIEERVQRAQVLESLGVLAGGVAHDFNNILVSILGTASLARMGLTGGHELRGPLREIEVAATRASELCDQLLACAGRGQVHRESLDANQVVADMAALLRSSVPGTVQLSVELGSDPLPVLADATQLRQVLLNLVINAGEACNDSGRSVTVRTGLVAVGRRRLDAAFAGDGLPAGEYASIEVEDDGVGVARDVTGRLFDPFFSTKFTGRGLGLSAVLGIVRSHAGALELVSEPGRGSVFRVLLPRSEGAPIDRTWQTAESAAVGEATVLVVDDEPLVRRTVRRILEGAGHRVVEAAGGVEALELLTAGHGFDVVLLDLTMPGMSGAEVWHKLRERGLAVPVVVISGFAEQEVLRRFGEGLSGLVRKPFTAQQLRVAVDEALFGPDASGPTLPASGTGRTVLVVDDDEGVRRTCSRILSSAGYSVRTACDGEEALSLYDAGTDVVLLDLVMPVLDGTETFERLLAVDADVRVLFFCGARIDQLRADLLAAGARGVVGKPVSAERLLEAVGEALI